MDVAWGFFEFPWSFLGVLFDKSPFCRRIVQERSKETPRKTSVSI